MNRLVWVGVFAVMTMTLFVEQMVHADNPAAGAETIETTEAFPTVGQPTTLVISTKTTKNNVVKITYSPTSALSSHESVKFVPETHRVSWTPQRAGVVELAVANSDSSASAQTTTNQTIQTIKKNISVRFDGVPRSGVAVMIIAGLFLFGGAFFSLRSLLAQD